ILPDGRGFRAIRGVTALARLPWGGWIYDRGVPRQTRLWRVNGNEQELVAIWPTTADCHLVAHPDADVVCVGDRNDRTLIWRGARPGGVRHALVSRGGTLGVLTRRSGAMKILFVGAGAIGSYLGAFLTRAGQDVTLIDPWAEQVETVRAKGISVSGPHDPFEARPAIYHLHEAQRLPRDFDVAFVAMKVYDTAWATQLALRHLKPEGFVVAAENCWPDPVVASIAGKERSVGLVMSKIGVASWKAGQVERGHERGGATGHDVFR